MIRYQKMTSNGIEWTDWFKSLADSASDNVDELENKIKSYKESDCSLKKTKLKHEYKIAEYVEPEPVTTHVFRVKKPKKK